MLNVAASGGRPCWLCLKALTTDLAPCRGTRRSGRSASTCGATFNRSADLRTGQSSYWTVMRGLDPRVATIEAWEAATREDRFFPLHVAWRPDGRSIGQVMADMLDTVAPPELPATADGLALLVTECASEAVGPRRRGRRRP